MAVILSRLKHTWSHTRKGRVLAALVVLFALLNGFVYLAHRQQTYASTTINGQPVGSVSLSALPDKLQDLPLLPKSIALTYEGKSTLVTPAELGMQVDAEQTAEQLVGQRSPLPVANYFTTHDAALSVKVDPKIYAAKIAAIGKAYKKEPASAVLLLRAGDFSITPEQDAITVDASGTQSRVIDALMAGRDRAEIMMKRTPPAVTKSSLEPRLQTLQAQRKTAVTLTFGAKTKRFTAEEVGSWFIPQPEDTTDGYTLAGNRLADAVSDAGLELGARVTNAAETAAAIRQAIETKQAATLALAGNPLGKKAYVYCTAVRGLPETELAALDLKAASVLGDKRGWGLVGNVTFTKAAPGAGCDFTLWLSAASQMPTFGAICDPEWSCAVRPNVIINFDRWKGASAAWNRDGGNLEDYRVMVINHEVGHWLGFDHSSCPAPGLPAPVMQQQSINLQGCSFSPWPSNTERTALRDFLGL